MKTAIALGLGYALSVTQSLARGDDGADKLPPVSRSLGTDTVGLFHHAGAGAVEQFTRWDSWALIGAAALGTFTLIALEDRWQQSVERAGLLGSGGRLFGDVAGIVTSAPLIPVGAYFVGRALEQQHLVAFGLETTATQGIVMIETLILSQIPIHSRPIVARGEVSDDEQPFFNRFFRGASSLPSGHVGGISALMFKGWEWYGPRVGVPAAVLTAIVGYARVEEGQHYTSDIFSTIALAGIASLATSRTRSLWRAYVSSEFVVHPWVAADSTGLRISGSW